MTIVALVPAAGRGERLGLGIPVGRLLIGAEPLLVHAVRRLLEAGVDEVIVAVGRDDLETAAGLLAGLATVVVGGSDPVASVRVALEYVDADSDVILVHDAARAFVPVSVIRAVVEAVRAGSAAVVPMLPVVDTIRSVGPSGVLDRNNLRVVQTPQGFHPDVLRRAHARAAVEGSSATDDAGLVEQMGLPVTLVHGHRSGFKVTSPPFLDRGGETDGRQLRSTRG